MLKEPAQPILIFPPTLIGMIGGIRRSDIVVVVFTVAVLAAVAFLYYTDGPGADSHSSGEGHSETISEGHAEQPHAEPNHEAEHELLHVTIFDPVNDCSLV